MPKVVYFIMTMDSLILVLLSFLWLRLLFKTLFSHRDDFYILMWVIISFLLVANGLAFYTDYGRYVVYHNLVPADLSIARYADRTCMFMAKVGLAMLTYKYIPKWFVEK